MSTMEFTAPPPPCPVADLVPPVGGTLVELRMPRELRDEARRRAALLPSVTLTRRQLCDLELLATGAFSPLSRFMGRDDYESVLASMRLADGTPFGIPVTLPVTQEIAGLIGREIALRDERNEILAVMTVEEAFAWRREVEQLCVLGSTDSTHPLVAEMSSWPAWCVSGALEVIALPRRLDFARLRRTPAAVRAALAELGNPRVVAFQTRNPLHRAHEELCRRAANRAAATLLLHPAVGMTRPGDVDHVVRVRACEAAVPALGATSTLLSLLPLAMRMAGPREAIWHALIRKNFGAGYFIVGRDHASPGRDSLGSPFWEPDAAHQLVEEVAPELGIEVISFDEMVYVPAERRYEERYRVPPGCATLSLSGTQVRDEYLAQGKPLPEWFTSPPVARVLAQAHVPPERQGFCLWLTGLPSAGKSTLAEHLEVLLQECGRVVTVLDGDAVRHHLSKGLGFSREDRDANVLRVAYVASEIVRHGGAVICALVSPYRETREKARVVIGTDKFLEVFVDAPLPVCEERDIKGLYARARQGMATGVTGIDDPYEIPLRPEVRVDTSSPPAEDAAWIMDLVTRRGFVTVPGRDEGTPTVRSAPADGANRDQRPVAAVPAGS